MPRRRMLAASLTALAVVVALTSCTPSEPQPVPSSSPSPTHTALGDGVLTIGTLFPLTGAQSFIAAAQTAGVAAAIKDIDSAGGVRGKPVVLVADDSGEASTQVAEASFADLIAKHADVVIGPSSTVLAQRLVPKAVAADVAMISPAATGIALTAVSDSGLLYRTIPSAALEGPAIAQAIGKAKVAYISFDDPTGTAVLATLSSAEKALGGSVISQKFSATTTDYAPIIAAVKAAAPDAVAFVSPFGSITQNTAVLSALNAAGLGGAKLWLAGAAMADYSQALPAGTLNGVNGVLEGAAPSAALTAELASVAPGLASTLYAAEAYDATIVAALAASAAAKNSPADDTGASLASELRAVTEGGIKCTTYAECITVLKTSRNIDYDGVSGGLAFDANGDVTTGAFGTYKYDAANRFSRVGSVTVR